MTAKDIAFKVILSFTGGGDGGFALKYFSAEHVLTKIQDYTNDPKLIQKSYKQVWRAFKKLGYTVP